jgi:LysM repeat protein
MQAKYTPIHRIRRRGILLLALIALAGALLPSGVFAADSDATRLGSPEFSTGRYQPRGKNQGYNRNQYNRNQYNRNYNQYNDNYNRPQYNDNYKQSSKGCATTYKVRKGDTLSGIAKHFHVSVNSLARANGIKNPNQIFAGQVLCIPSGPSYGYSYGHSNGRSY